jgi:alpha-beta hydrolase superfamily lysophospholipase
MRFKRKPTLKKLFIFFSTIFILMNIVAFFHAYKFTHFIDKKISKTKGPDKLTLLGKAKALTFGINNPRPYNTKVPSQPFETIILKSNKKIECWHINTVNSKGTVVIFHGYSGEKASMIANSDEVIKLGYSTFLVDFMGSCGSEGNQTTLGFKESEEVFTVYNYLKQQGEKNIILYGTSMGSVAIMKAIYDYNIEPNSIIIECPFGSMYKTTCARFKIMNVPSFPMAGLLDFWGGIQNGFWAFGHNPTKYAKSISCPTLLLYGEQDKNVSREEIDDIYKNLKGTKELKTFKGAEHENYLLKYESEWLNYVQSFLNLPQNNLCPGKVDGIDKQALDIRH